MACIKNDNAMTDSLNRSFEKQNSTSSSKVEEAYCDHWMPDTSTSFLLTWLRILLLVFGCVSFEPDCTCSQRANNCPDCHSGDKSAPFKLPANNRAVLPWWIHRAEQPRSDRVQATGSCRGEDSASGVMWETSYQLEGVAACFLCICVGNPRH